MAGFAMRLTRRAGDALIAVPLRDEDLDAGSRERMLQELPEAERVSERPPAGCALTCQHPDACVCE